MPIDRDRKKLMLTGRGVSRMARLDIYVNIVKAHGSDVMASDR